MHRLVIAFVLALTAAPAFAAPGDVVVFAAASLKDALDAVAAVGSGKHPVISYAASSALAKQIESGAPADIFISADLDWMDYLAEQNLIKPDTACNLLGNELVLIAPKDSTVQTSRSRPASRSPSCSATAGSRWPIRARCRPANTARRRSKSSASGRASPSQRRAGRECPRRAAARVARRGAARHRLPDRRGGRPGRQDRRHLPGGHASADHLSGRADRRARTTRTPRLPGLSARRRRPARLSRRRASRCSKSNG